MSCTISSESYADFLNCAHKFYLKSAGKLGNACELELLESDRPDVVRLRQEGISIVYRPAWGLSEGLLEPRPGIFVVQGFGDPGLAALPSADTR